MVVRHRRITARSSACAITPTTPRAIARAAQAADPLAVLRFHREMVKLQAVAQHPLNARLFIEQVLIAYRDCVQPPAAAA